MKKVIFLFFSFLFSANVNAQMWDNAKPDKPITIGIRGGVNLTSASAQTSGEKADMKMKIGFQGGMIMDYNIRKSIALETGLSFKSKSFRQVSSNQNFDVSLGYLQVPVQALIRLYINENAHVQLKGGGFAAYLVSKNPSRVGGDDIDFGYLFGAGVSLNRLYLGVEFENGLSEKRYVVTKTSSEYTGEISSKSSSRITFGFLIGYDF